jgi:hypothetical protein
MSAEKELIKKIQKEIDALRFETLKQRLDKEVILMHPEGKAAKKILARYAKGFRAMSIIFDLN